MSAVVGEVSFFHCEEYESSFILEFVIPITRKAVSISETSVNIYKTTQRNNPEVSNFHTRRRENLKSHKHVHDLMKKVKGLVKKFHNFTD
jgi:hypothetical protein